jgi:hypothetical protein
MRSPVERAPKARAGAGRHGRLHDEHRVGRACGNRLEHGLDAAQIGVSRCARRRVDAHERDLGLLEELGRGRRERQPLAIVGEQLLDAGLVDGSVTGSQALELRLVDVEADELVPRLGEARRRHESDVAHADDAQPFRRHVLRPVVISPAPGARA